ncbi:tyrosine-type recombinase/integrase [Streptantibioticus rubrisoli]|uniref:Tyrosine-type recombinase/integrase n=1 Tax=Streptantibioticus rubrisoli TaxID=1387313 RepID=A0ABT1PC84_9ACTN|nr:tyrosine-type recombinase/integrase [Streptantibioticus rubrisoli]MCQ4042983.1 tyrosine-type recombinase/integrase [Streptantibioticus rubrisoli]
MLTYDVDIWSIRKRSGRPKPWELRWRVGERPHSRSFKLKPQADGRRAELMAALRDHQQFDEETGLPAGELMARTSPSWYEHATGYVLMKWPRAAAKHRASIAESLAVVTPTLVTSRRGEPRPAVMRAALYQWAFRAVRSPEGVWVSRHVVEEPPAEIRSALEWIAARSLKVKDLDDPSLLRPALEAISLRLDGSKAAENTTRRKRMVLSNVLRYTVEERGLLAANPLPRVDWTPAESDDEIDFRYVPGPDVARALLGAVRDSGPRGKHLHAFFACLYYAAMRPSEVVALKESDCTLPPNSPDSVQKWGELLLGESRPEVGGGWTDDGMSYETRGLKRRKRGATRTLPIPPVLVHLLREHIAQYGTADDGRLFRAARGGRVASTEYCAVWEKARKAVLSRREVSSALAAVPYSLRHAGVSLWIKSGVDPAEVAARAGHSIAVLYRFYAKILKGGQQHSNNLIARALGEGDQP